MKLYFLPSSAASVGLVLLQPVEIFQEQEPRGLLGVIQLGGAAGFFPQDVVDVLECLFKHYPILSDEQRRASVVENESARILTRPIAAGLHIIFVMAGDTPFQTAEAKVFRFSERRVANPSTPPKRTPSFSGWAGGPPFHTTERTLLNFRAGGQPFHTTQANA